MNFRVIKKIIIFTAIFSLANFCLASDLTPNDPDYSKQWYLSQLQMPKVWSQETGKSSVIVAVIDSGVDINHPDLRDNIWVNQKEILGDGIDNDHNGYIDDANGWDFIENNNDPSPKYAQDCFKTLTCSKEAIIHGTMVAGLIAATGNNGFGVTGTAWQVKIMPLRVLNENGSGNTDDVVKAIKYAVNNGASIINFSFVGDTYDATLESTIEWAYSQGVLVVSAAGNENASGRTINLDYIKMYPVCFSGKNGENIVLGVAASDKKNGLANFSNFGSSCVDILAPGESIWGATVYNAKISQLNSYYGGEYSGTSLAAPIVSGIAALIKSANPSLGAKDIMDLILNNADNIDSISPNFVGKFGSGLINPVKIFKALKGATTESPLVKASGAAVYYLGADGKRYAFPDLSTYLSWYDDFKGVRTISDADLASIPLGGLVNYRPGSLIKISSVPAVYAVTHNGFLEWVSSEDLAVKFYGADWAKLVHDVPDSLFINYKIGDTLNVQSAFDPALIRGENSTIDIDREL